MDTKKIKTFSIYAGICAIALLCVIYFGYVIKLINLILSVVKPLVIGAVIAFAVNIIMKKMEKIYFPKSEKAFIQKTRRPVCVFLSFFILIGIIAAIIVLIVPSLKDAISIISSSDVPAFVPAISFEFITHGIFMFVTFPVIKEM